MAFEGLSYGEKQVQRLSICIPLETYWRIFKKCFYKGNVYSYRFRDIAVRR